MAYWPASGSLLTNINYSSYSVGIIQHFIQYNISLSDRAEKHLFCYIHWKQSHPCFDWFGQSAIVSSTLDEVVNACCYMPIQRIAYRCASATLSVVFEHINETVFVACPIAMKYYL